MKRFWLPMAGAASVFALLPAAAPALDASPSAAMAQARAALGRRLFHDGDLSLDGSMSCASCHGQRRGFAEGNRAHPGVTGEAGRRNVPGLANVGRRMALSWADPGQFPLEVQALTPITGTHPVEMGMAGKEAELTRRLSANACYRALFRAAYPGEAISLPTVAGALAAFQRTLVSDQAPIDRLRAGEAVAMTPQARRGAALFERDCAACHSGPDFTDDRSHRVAAPMPRDLGLAEISGKAEDEGRFRTPSLRNVTLSAPYFHDGESPTLAAAIRRHEGRVPDAEDEAALIAFLDLLTDHAFVTDPRFAYPDQPCEVTPD